MNEDTLNTLCQQDTNLRDAIRFEEMERPQMPADLNARLMKRVEAHSPSARVRKLWPWLAAACVAAFIAVYVTPPKDGTGDVMETLAVTAKAEQSQAPTPVAPKVEEPRHAVVPVEAPEKAKPQKPRQRAAATENLMAQQPAAPSAQTAVVETDLVATADPKAEAEMTVLSERDIPITRPENYQYTREELAQLKKQAAEAYLKWVELEMEISRNNLEQTAQK